MTNVHVVIDGDVVIGEDGNIPLGTSFVNLISAKRQLEQAIQQIDAAIAADPVNQHCFYGFHRRIDGSSDRS